MDDICTMMGKRRFEDAGQARTALRNLKGREKQGAGADVYRCDACNGWHIGHRKWQKPNRHYRKYTV